MTGLWLAGCRQAIKILKEDVEMKNFRTILRKNKNVEDKTVDQRMRDLVYNVAIGSPKERRPVKMVVENGKHKMVYV